MGDGQSSNSSDSDKPSQKQARGGKKEQTPDGPQDQQGQKPEQGKPEGGQPKGNQGNPPPSPKKLANAAPNDPTQDPLMASRDREQWGNLPIHMQKLFRAGGSDTVPVRYRDWIDSYYRKLNDR